MKHSAPRALTVAAAGVIVALTVAAFWLSYAHLESVAANHGLASSAARAWAWPATLDLFIVAGELLLLRASLTARTDWWAVGLTVTGSGSSIALNISGVGAHAHTLAYVVAAVPPTAALLAFGALMRQVHDALTDTPATTADPVSDATAPSGVVAPEPAGQPASAPVPVTEPDAPTEGPVTSDAPAAGAARPRARQTPGAGKTSRPVRNDDELVADLNALRTGAAAPLSQRRVLAALGIGVPRLRALMDAHGLSLDPLPAPAAPAPLHLVDSDQRQPAAAAR